MKSASLSDLVFPAGLGTPVMASATDLNITNPTATKQCLNRATGILVLAADKDSRYYLHNYIDLISSAPKIISFIPASGPVGTQVTITGSQFTGATKVAFNGTPASFVIDSDTQLRATVPAGATSGKIIVINAFDAGSSATDYFVTAPPTISSFTPTNGPAGAQVTISGNNFIGATSVAFNETNTANFIVDSNTQIRADVPADAPQGGGKISVTNADGSAVSANIFTVTATPIIFSFSPVRAIVGTEITVTGSRFSGATSVSFNGTPAAFTLDTEAQIRATVPAGATTGAISITNSAGTGTSESNFIVQYTLTVSNTGSGSVDLNPAGNVYDENAVVTLTAIPATGWEFYDWGDDLDGSAATMPITMNADKRVTAKFRPIAQYTVTINLAPQSGGKVTLDPPGGVYYVGTVVTLTAAPAAGYVFSGYSGDFKGWTNAETLKVNANKNLTATFSPLPAPRASQGIWTSAVEINKLPTAGLGWDNLKTEADAPTGLPNLSDNEDSVGVAILAKALVYARTGDETYRQAVISSCLAAIGTEQNGDALAFGRELLAYVLAADLVGLPPAEDATFRNWLRSALTENIKSHTLRSAHEQRPNNWGTHCGATRAAIARYLGDATELERTARVFKGWLGDRNTYADFSFDHDSSWQANPNAPVGVNPVGATIQGHSVDGVLPEDQRRSGPFVWPPPKENYVYGALQGALMQATILYRAGYDVWNWENQALLRAMKWLYHEADYPADGDDEWLPHIVNYFYKASFPAPFPAVPGKNAGWTDWLYGSKHALTVSEKNGDVLIHSLGAVNDSLAVMRLAAIPDANYFFNNWSGDLSGAKNPDTLIMNADKNVIANFLKAGPFTVTVNVIGSGAVTMDPSGGVYYGGTVVKLTAAPASGFIFTGWSGDLSGATNPASLMIAANKNITATFKAVYKLTTNVVGSGTIALNPPDGLYEFDTVVTLAATPAEGYRFVEWSGNLSGAANPATIIMNANKNVTATFTVVRVVHEETQTGGSSSSAIVATTASLTAAKDQLYLAAITTRPQVNVTAVSGLNLDWTFVKAQCAGRNNIGIELWMAQGYATSIGDSTVTANLASAPYNAVIVVSRYSGAAHGETHPLGDIVSGNTRGLDGPCDGGFDNTSYSFNLTTLLNGTLVYAAAGMRNRTHTSGAGFIERAEIKQGSSSSVAALAVEDKVFPAAGTATVNGTFDSNTDWVVVAVAIKPQASDASPDDFDDPAGKPPLNFQLYPNYPNPFNLQTNIEYSLPEETSVRLSVYNLFGQKIRTLVNGVQSAGRNLVQWNGTDDAAGAVGAGIYLIRLEAGAQRLTRRVVLLK
jgi:hypothetical protein